MQSDLLSLSRPPSGPVLGVCAGSADPDRKLDIYNLSMETQDHVFTIHASELNPRFPVSSDGPVPLPHAPGPPPLRRAGPGHGSGSKGWKIVASCRVFQPSPSSPSPPQGRLVGSQRDRTATSGSPSEAANTDRDDQPDDPRHHRVPHPHRQLPARRDHGGPRRQSLVHRGFGNKIGMINPTTHAITEFPSHAPRHAVSHGDHGGPRRQPLVHRVRGRQDRR